MSRSWTGWNRFNVPEAGDDFVRCVYEGFNRWEHYLGRLAVAAAGGDPGPDPFVGAVAAMMAPND
jgi:hypothetical protein